MEKRNIPISYKGIVVITVIIIIFVVRVVSLSWSSVLIRRNEALRLMLGGGKDEVLVRDAASVIDKVIRLADKIGAILSGVPVV